MEANNMAVMREALVWLQKTGHRTPEGGWMCITLKMTQKDGMPYPIEVPPHAEDVINDALSAPPRNCDRFADELDAQLAFLNEVWLISVDRETMLERDRYENWSDEMRKEYGRWLLATATDQKGDGDGSN